MGVHIEVCGRSGHGLGGRGHHLLAISIQRSVGSIVGFQGTGLQDFNWGAEALFLGEFDSGADVAQGFHHRGLVKDTAYDVLDTVVGDQMVGHAHDSHAHCLLHQTLGTVGVEQGPDQCPLDLGLMGTVCELAGGRGGRRIALATVAVVSRIGLPRAGRQGSSGLLHIALLLPR